MSQTIVLKQLQAAKQAAQRLAQLSTGQKNTVLKTVAKHLQNHHKKIIAANQRDFKRLPSDYALADRLRLTVDRITNLADSIRAVVTLPDPIGVVIDQRTRPTGLHIKRLRVPFGVVGIIYEARPNVTTEIFSLGFKTGNAVVLKGGRDADCTNRLLVQLIHQVLRRYHLPTAAITRLDPFDTTATPALLGAHGLVDVIIPRGSNRLIEYVREHATVPVIETGAGVCHTYVEGSANLAMATRVVTNAKVRRCTVCNALDCLLLDKAIVKTLLPRLAKSLLPYGVLLHADTASVAVLKSCYPTSLLQSAKTSDYGKEWLSLQLTIKTVANFNKAVSYIQRYSSGHSEAIITGQPRLAQKFTQQIDAAAVYVNTATAFTDGFEFGLGAEVGISTQKLHARGPMGLVELTTYKWVITSNGAVRTV
ncbi:MAG: glutamate-5-semialdehyde dehydrogenase [Candidatus Kerfeldbacteria bacterium]|nr:glutamate-5-semialdehyde dehydrogenase [Candidatus Kerfeldbacteria bacterium]